MRKISYLQYNEITKATDVKHEITTTFYLICVMLKPNGRHYRATIEIHAFVYKYLSMNEHI